MRSFSLALLLVLTVAAFCPAKLPQERGCAAAESALKAVAKLKAGDTRAKVEQAFTQDGGLNLRATTRYGFKGCAFIKIDVQFSFPKSGDPTQFGETDRVESISKPYVEYPVYD